MISTILLVFFSLIGLITLHELGHFAFARKFGVKVEEFGMFLPPRIWGKKFGETLYSINWIPAGAFVKLQGEDSAEKDDPRSFGSKPIWQRALIIAAGVISFWLVAVVIYTFVFLSGAIEQVDDSDPAADAKVQIISISADSPAQAAGLQMGDIIVGVGRKDSGERLSPVDKIGQVQEFAAERKGEEIAMEIRRAGQNLEVAITPRVDPPAGQGAMGIALIRTAQKTYTWWQAIGNGFLATWNMTIGVFDGWGQIISRLANNEGMPEGAQMVGPVGIMDMMAKQAEMGASYYLQFVAMISVYLAVFNALPIPALDGGRLMFLAVEAVRRRPVSEKIEQLLTMFFFAALMLFAIIVTVQDVRRLF
ncbi:MAG: site-2 protease family protein [Candidatus Nealsonbacteria bacterium DGGOD1a]|jgi:RIP metalloprotease RseP|nr:MAG: site-2 protease family protein [Candidatus Nealsonbacteria bacterium DGGOD1a]